MHGIKVKTMPLTINAEMMSGQGRMAIAQTYRLSQLLVSVEECEPEER